MNSYTSFEAMVAGEGQNPEGSPMSVFNTVKRPMFYTVSIRSQDGASDVQGEFKTIKAAEQAALSQIGNTSETYNYVIWTRGTSMKERGIVKDGEIVGRFG